MKVYVVRQQGVYWHEIMFVSLSRETATEQCRKMALADYDSYHYWIVSEFDTANPPMMNEQTHRFECSTTGYEVEIFKTRKHEELQLLEKDK